MSHEGDSSSSTLIFAMVLQIHSKNLPPFPEVLTRHSHILKKF